MLSTTVLWQEPECHTKNSPDNPGGFNTQSLELRHTQSALKHGVTPETITHIIRTGDFLGSDSDGGLWWVGCDENGEGVEVIAHTLESRAIVTYHAMRWRKK